MAWMTSVQRILLAVPALVLAVVVVVIAWRTGSPWPPQALSSSLFVLATSGLDTWERFAATRRPCTGLPIA
jgi:ABC-type proline/glycine betaine transport system permease subunit